MLNAKNNIFLQVNKVLDIILSYCAFECAYYIKLNLLPLSLRGLIQTPNYSTVLLLIILIWPILFNYFKLYDSSNAQAFKPICFKVAKSIFTGLIILNFVMYLLKITDISRIMMCIFLLTNFIFIILSKIIVYKIKNEIIDKGRNNQNILIIGGRNRARTVINEILEHGSSGYRIVGCLGVEEGEIGKCVINDIYYTGVVSCLYQILIDQVIDQVVIALPLDLIDNIEKNLNIAEKLGVTVRIMPDWNLHKIHHSAKADHLQIDNFFNIPMVCIHAGPSVNGAIELKGLVDFLGAAALIVLLLPLLVGISILIKIFSKGPVLFVQERCGLNGRVFPLYKFRTMAHDAEEKRKALDRLNEADGPVFKIKRDPRITPFLGSFLRKTGLDELPQLLNVIKGEMSLVGPRPPIPAEVKNYDLWQRRRLSVKPGITGLWQCSDKRNDISFKEWVSLDLNYIDSWSLTLDLKILIKTVFNIFTGQGR